MIYKRKDVNYIKANETPSVEDNLTEALLKANQKIHSLTERERSLEIQIKILMGN